MWLFSLTQDRPHLLDRLFQLDPIDFCFEINTKFYKMLIFASFNYVGWPKPSIHHADLQRDWSPMIPKHDRIWNFCLIASMSSNKP